MKNIKIDVLIIGAGPSGSVAAAYLQNKDINFMVIEKNEFPRFAIGESLLPRCMDHFQEVGLIDCISEYGFEIKPTILNGNRRYYDKKNIDLLKKIKFVNLILAKNILRVMTGLGKSLEPTLIWL